MSNSSSGLCKMFDMTEFSSPAKLPNCVGQLLMRSSRRGLALTRGLPSTSHKPGLIFSNFQSRPRNGCCVSGSFAAWQRLTPDPRTSRFGCEMAACDLKCYNVTLLRQLPTTHGSFCMKTVVLALVLALIPAFGQGTPARAEDRIAVVAAENFYGDIAKQIGGERVAVTSIMNNPDQDPHLFETTPAIVRQLAGAQIAILNGANYEPWMDKALARAPRAGRIVISAAQLTGRKPGDNPHLWYDPATMPAVATALAEALSKADSAHASDYAGRLKTTLAALDRISQRVTQLKAKHAGAVVTATEPVFGPMAQALGLAMRNERFQLAMMNDTEPSARDVAAFEKNLRERKVRVVIYNSQVSEKLTERLRDIAGKSRVPVIGVTETMPPNVSFQDWVLGELDALDKALSGPNS